MGLTFRSFAFQDFLLQCDLCGGKGRIFLHSPAHNRLRETDRDWWKEKERVFKYQKSRLVYSSRQALDESLVQGIVPDSAVMQV